jgi:ABC-2 type transport system permease protein
MHNTWLILKREYRERVRTKSFLLSTFAVPLFIIAAMVLPSKFAEMKSFQKRHIVVAAADAQLTQAVRKEIVAKSEKLAGAAYTVDVENNLSDQTRTDLRNRVSSYAIDGYVWLSPEEMADEKVTYSARETTDFVEIQIIQDAVNRAYTLRQLEARGLPQTDIQSLVKEFKVETAQVQAGKESNGSGKAAFLSALVLMMMLYITVILHGVAVMRAVLEEKSSRVMEVLLSTVRAQELMAGKILGVGAVGVTQVLIWVATALVFTFPSMAGYMHDVHLSPVALLLFVVFYLGGYLLYSAMYAALGAAVNSEQEAQQWQMLIMSPLILCTVMMMIVMRQPSAPVSVWASMIPFFSPLLMYLRISIQMPPVWQIVLSIGLLAVTIWFIAVLCARIYRVGVLMYGKRPTLPEIIKWLKYAKS